MTDAIDRAIAKLLEQAEEITALREAAAMRHENTHRLITETAADLFHGWLLSQGWTEPPADPEGCGMCEFRAAMVRALKEGQ